MMIKWRLVTTYSLIYPSNISWGLLWTVYICKHQDTENKVLSWCSYSNGKIMHKQILKHLECHTVIRAMKRNKTEQGDRDWVEGEFRKHGQKGFSETMTLENAAEWSQREKDAQPQEKIPWCRESKCTGPMAGMCMAGLKNKETTVLLDWREGRRACEDTKWEK